MTELELAAISFGLAWEAYRKAVSRESEFLSQGASRSAYVNWEDLKNSINESGRAMVEARKNLLLLALKEAGEEDADKTTSTN